MRCVSNKCINGGELKKSKGIEGYLEDLVEKENEKERKRKGNRTRTGRKKR